MSAPEPPPQHEARPESIAEIVLGPTGVRAPSRFVWAALATVAIHGAAGTLAWQAWQRESSRAAMMAAARPPLRIDHVVELPPPAPAVPLPPPEEEPPPPPPPRRARAEAPPNRVKPTSPPAAREDPAPPPPEPAQAAEVVAAKAAEAPLDFTGFDIVSGQAPRYAGGVTAPTGTSTRAVVAGAITEAGSSASSRARPVQLPARNWSCPWPQEADALRIDEQTVVLRVVVTPEGNVTSAELLADPGYGFGQAALACARRARFEAAFDSSGRPSLATSPPIRVRFTRR